MRLYVQDRHTEAMAILLRLADKRREHTYYPLRSQARCLAWIRPTAAAQVLARVYDAGLGGPPGATGGKCIVSDPLALP